MRPVKNRHKAIERLAPLIDGVETEPIGRGRYRIVIDGAQLPPAEKDSKKTLAFLAEEARHTFPYETVKELVNWTGSVPLKGLNAWQEHALSWLQG